MKRSLTVLVTGAGAPGIRGTVYSLQCNPDRRPVTIVGTDVRRDAVGRHMVDAFECVPPPEAPEYVAEFVSACERHCVDVVVPQTTRELEVLSMARSDLEAIGVSLAISDPDSVSVANNKIAVLKEFRRIGLPHPAFRVAASEASLIAAVEGLGYPRMPVAVKPPRSNGMRGFRVLREDSWDVARFMSEKPSGVDTTLVGLLEVLRRGEAWPELLVTEYLPGVEHSVDVFLGRSAAVAVPRRRSEIRSGISFHTHIVDRRDLSEWSLLAARAMGMRYAFGFQYKDDVDGTPKVLECNPRVQGTMVASLAAGINIIWLAVLEAIGEDVTLIPEPRSEGEYQRYWGGILVAGSSRSET